jgi:DNA-binding MarR family transcriptional regulator
MRPGSTSKPITAHLRTSAGRVPVAINARGMHASESRSNPAAFRALVDVLGRGGSVEVAIPDIDKRRLDLALLHSAHLLLFREFSYGYLLTNVGEHLRSILNSPQSFTEPPYLILEVPAASAVDRRVLFRVGIAELRDKTRCLFAALPVANPAILCQLMLLPGLGPEDVSNFRRVARARDGKWLENVQFSTVSGGSSVQLAAPEFAFQLLNLWRGAKPYQIRIRALLQRLHSISPSSRVDALDVRARLGIFGRQLSHDLGSLVELGFIERIPRSRKPYLVRVTQAGAKALARRSRHVPALAQVFDRRTASALLRDENTPQ